MHLLVIFIKLPKLRVYLKRTFYRNIQLIRYHLGNTVAKIVRQVQRTSYITNHAFCRHRTECDNLYNLIRAIFLTYIVDNLLPALIAKININIRHRYTLRIEKTLKKKTIAYRVNVRNLQTIRNNGAGCASAPRTYGNAVLTRPVNKIPNNQEVVHISHILYDIQLIVKLLYKRSVIIGVTLL